MLKAAVSALSSTSQTAKLPLRELFASDAAAALMAARLVQLLGHPSELILQDAWIVCCYLSRNSANRRVLLDAGLLQLAHFVRAMASSQADIRSHASALLNLCARK